MHTSDDVAGAREFAATLHRDDTYGDQSYLEGHLDKVAAGVTTETEKIVAYLHDTLEDHGDAVTFHDLSRDFGPGVAIAIAILTKEPEETYAQYIDQVASSGNALAITVKLSDANANANAAACADDFHKDPTIKGEKRYLRYLTVVLKMIDALAQLKGTK